MCVFVCGGISSHIKPLVKSGVLFSLLQKNCCRFRNNSFVVRCLSFFLGKKSALNAQLKPKKVGKKNNSQFVISALLSFDTHEKTKHEHHVEHGVENQHDRGGGVRLERYPGAGEIVRFYFSSACT
tara:strand:- start:490 stop:867 length:378 start_codon:yes stop_codon:yes gene_type:complete